MMPPYGGDPRQQQMGGIGGGGMGGMQPGGGVPDGRNMQGGGGMQGGMGMGGLGGILQMLFSHPTFGPMMRQYIQQQFSGMHGRFAGSQPGMQPQPQIGGGQGLMRPMQQQPTMPMQGQQPMAPPMAPPQMQGPAPMPPQMQGPSPLPPMLNMGGMNGTGNYMAFQPLQAAQGQELPQPQNIYQGASGVAGSAGASGG